MARKVVKHPKRTPQRKRTEYSWAEGMGLPSVPADVVGRWVQRFERDNGRPAKRADLLDAARPEESPLHALFNWSDESAAEQWRLHQASMFLCRLRIEVITPAGRTHTVRAFVSVAPPGQDRGFMPYDRVMNDSNLRGQFVSSALDDLQMYADKFATLLEYPSVRVAYGMFESAVASLRRGGLSREAAE